MKGFQQRETFTKLFDTAISSIKTTELSIKYAIKLAPSLPQHVWYYSGKRDAGSTTTTKGDLFSASRTVSVLRFTNQCMYKRG